MVYKINNKYYIKVQGYYKEVNITPKGDGFIVKANNDSKIEITKVKNVNTVNLKTEFKTRNPKGM